jgi:hypothetical protein
MSGMRGPVSRYFLEVRLAARKVREGRKRLMILFSQQKRGRMPGQG